MTISNNYAPLRQLGNGVTTEFSDNWAMLSAAYAEVFLEDAITGAQTQVTEGPGDDQYTLTFNSSGFTVTFNTAPTSANYVIVSRNVALDQTNPYRTSKGFQGEVEEASFDKLTAIAQDTRSLASRALTVPLGDTANTQFPSAAERANKLAAFDAGGNVVLQATNDAGVDTVTALGSSTPRSLAQRFADDAHIFDFIPGGQQNAILNGTSTYDATSDLTRLIAQANTAKVTGILTGGNFNIGNASIANPSIVLRGKGRNKTKLVGFSSGNLLDILGGYGAANHINFIQLEEMGIDGGTTSTKALHAKGSSLLHLKNVDFSGCTGNIMYLDEVYDSWFEDTNFKNGGSTNHAIYINFGSGDNSNILRFSGCTWETNPYGAVLINSGSLTTESVYGIVFDRLCKFENNASLGLAPAVLIQGGTAPAEFIRFDNPYLYITDATNSFLKITGGARSIRMNSPLGIYASIVGSTCKPIMDLSGVASSAFQVSLDNAYLYGAQSVSTYHAIKTTGAAAANFITGRNNLYSDQRFYLCDLNTAIGEILEGPVSINANGVAPDLALRRGDASVGGTAITSINGTGHYVAYVNGQQIWDCDPATGEFAMQNGMAASGTWNSGNLMRYGSYRFWVDSSGRLRIKNGVPTGDTDGTVVGTQS